VSSVPLCGNRQAPDIRPVTSYVDDGTERRRKSYCEFLSRTVHKTGDIKPSTRPVTSLAQESHVGLGQRTVAITRHAREMIHFRNARSPVRVLGCMAWFGTILFRP
jgi:hypothetical protein